MREMIFINNNSPDDLELLKQQLELVKQQDRWIGEIEMELYKMREIAQYAAAHKLFQQETVQLTKRLQAHQEEIDGLKNKVLQNYYQL